MLSDRFVKKFYRKGGEEKMKTLRIILTIAMVSLLMPALTLAADKNFTVNASVAGGTSFGQHTLLKCYGYKFAGALANSADPWNASNCPQQTTGGLSLDFGGLVTQLYDVNGNTTVGADCFYGRDFFIVYLYPDAWGGKSCDITQTTTITDPDLASALVFTPVYSDKDKFDTDGNGTGDREQGALGANVDGVNYSYEIGDNPNINQPRLAAAASGARVLKVKRARIVRAQYGIPPKPATGDTRPTNWKAIPITKAAGSITGTVKITLTEGN